jgi:hypothetical protein
MKSKSPFYQDKCAEARAKKKASYMSRKSKTGLDMSKKDKSGKFLKKEIPISAEDNLKEFNREIKEFECVDGELKIKQNTND